MSNIRKVMVVGASDKSIGAAVVKALTTAGFTVSVLSRSVSTSSVPVVENVTVVKTDYTPSSLRSALTGQDAVVSCVGFAGLMAQLDVIDAAEAVGVQRFVPSEFGNDTRSENGLEDLKMMLLGKREVLQRLVEVAGRNERFSWTGLATGPFIDWLLLHNSLGFNLTTSTATIYDSGNEPFTGTLLAEISQSICRILQNPTATRNKYLRIRSIRSTQNALLAAFEANNTSEKKWTVAHLNTADVLVSAREKMKQGDRSSFGDLAAVQFFQDGCGRGVIAGNGEEEKEEGVELLKPRSVDEDELVKLVLSQASLS